MSHGNKAPLALALAAALFLSSTGAKPTTPPHVRRAISTAYQGTNKPTAAEQKWVDKNCKFGLPKPLPAAPIGPTRLVFREGYVLEHSSELRIPLWVCESLEPADLSGSVTGRLKPEPFGPDPALEKWPRAQLHDYKKSGFARGHLSPDANRTRTKKLKAETYVLSNMVPQAGNKFNSSIWLTLEKNVRAWAKEKPLWIITGVLIHDPREDDVNTAVGVVEYYTIGKSPVGIPTHLFKIIVAEESSGTFDARAFIFDNKSYEKGEDLAAHLTTIRWIEQRAGFDFLPKAIKGVTNDQIKKLKDREFKEVWPTP